MGCELSQLFLFNAYRVTKSVFMELVDRQGLAPPDVDPPPLPHGMAAEEDVRDEEKQSEGGVEGLFWQSLPKTLAAKATDEEELGVLHSLHHLFLK